MPNAGLPCQGARSIAANKPQGPGQERPYPKPSESGNIMFKYEPNGLQGWTRYWLWGDLSCGKVPLICLHGGPGVPHNYLLPLSLIHEDHGVPVVMYDQVGCGKSTRFKDKRGDKELWTPALFMADLENVIKALRIKEFDLLGQSWGGMLAGQFAIEKQPKGLRKLIISNSPSDVNLWINACMRQREGLPQEVQDTLDRCEKEGQTDTEEYEAAVMEFYKLHMCRLDEWPTELNDSFASLTEDNTVYYTMWGPSEFFLIGNLEGWTITNELSKITSETCPGGVLVLNGYYDEAQDETTIAYWSKPSAKTKWVTFQLSAHMPMLEETEKYLAVLGSFLTSA